ncbi:hypothetical protein, partial [Methanothrix soehngenii]|uniref:hypothetical protein n=1 Tax=Methanothrix soehngenii TaxID=2223 RepID=UPI002CFC5743|nr:hypothetical protein [Methanothrix soehngenii]HOS23643.1 hypothetical protein [Methanothrix soehngenii]HPL21921.1 hypothetical protein [Methanothrix soehngenii]
FGGLLTAFLPALKSGASSPCLCEERKLPSAATIGLLKRQSEPSVAISLVQIEEYYYFSC